jgi:hypothetical protein
MFAMIQHNNKSKTMANTTTGCPALDLNSIIPPIIDGFAKQVYPSLVFVLEATFFTALLVPILLSVLFFSTSHSRGTLMWRIVVLEILFGLALGLWSMHTAVSTFTPKEWVA